MEGDFLRLHLNDIEDMLLLIAHNKLNNLDGNVIVHLAVGLCMYTQRIVIQSRVEDLQLGVESYQKKLNISKLRSHDVDLSRRAPYTTLLEPQGVIYEDNMKRKRLMRTDKLYKFSDDTLTSVCNTLDQMLKNLRLGYKKNVYEELREVRWWKGLWDWLQAIAADNMTLSYSVLLTQTKTELTLEQTQQGVSDEVLVSIEGVKELKGNVRIKGVKKEALHILRQYTKKIKEHEDLIDMMSDHLAEEKNMVNIKQTKISELEKCLGKKDSENEHLKSKVVDFTTVQNLRAQVEELQSENEHLKSKVVDCTMCQNIQVQVEELKSVNESLNLSVELLSKEEQSDIFHEVPSEFDSEIVHDTQDNSKRI
ncbi:hypothetical protein Tco_1246442 [Tanacetum coccineum]